MNYCIFYPKLAEMFGIKEAIILGYLDMWIGYNKHDDRNFHDGHYWTYNSLDALATDHPYMSKRTIQGVLNNLVEQGVVLKGNYNKLAFDRTCWYTLTDKYYTLVNDSQPISQKREMHIANSATSDVANSTTPIPYNNKSNNNNNSAFADALFDKLWSMYPKKRGKSSVKPATRKKLLDVGETEMIRAVKRYADECKGKDPQYIMNGSTFFNGRYEDYLGDDYKPIPTGTPAQNPSKPYVPEPPRYQKFEKEEHIDAVPMPKELREKKEQLLRGMSI